MTEQTELESLIAELAPINQFPSEAAGVVAKAIMAVRADGVDFTNVDAHAFVRATVAERIYRSHIHEERLKGEGTSVAVSIIAEAMMMSIMPFFSPADFKIISEHFIKHFGLKDELDRIKAKRAQTQEG